jgi:hypothetical protein
MPKDHGNLMLYCDTGLQKETMGKQKNNFQLTETWVITTKTMLYKSTAELACPFHSNLEFGASAEV